MEDIVSPTNSFPKLLIKSMGHFGSGSEISSFSIMSKLRTGDTDFINPTSTSLVNLALMVGVVIPVSREISRNDLWPSSNSDFRIDTCSHLAEVT
jgi:hypothetical protein